MSCRREKEATAYVLEAARADYDAHLADCPDCQQAVADAAETLEAIAPALADAQPEPPVEAPAKSKVPNWPLYLSIGLAAAVILLNFLNPMAAPEPPPVEPDIELAWNDPLDTTLDELDAELDDELLALEAL